MNFQIDNVLQENSEVFMCHPLDYSGNINRGISGNYYTNNYKIRPFLIGVFSNETYSKIRIFSNIF